MNPWTPLPKIFAGFLRRDCNESHQSHLLPDGTGRTPAALPVLPYREPEIFRSCAELDPVFAKRVFSGCSSSPTRASSAAASPGQSDEIAASRFVRAILDLNAWMGFPSHLEGIQSADIPVMAAHAEKEANPLYPVPRLMAKEEPEGFHHQFAAVGEVHLENQAICV